MNDKLPTRLLKSELVERYDILLENAARWLASEGVVVKRSSLFGGEKEVTWIGHEKRKRFTDDDVESIKAVLEEWTDRKFRGHR